MVADRLIPTSATPGAVEGDDFMDAVQEELTGLWDRSSIHLTAIGGTADAITATLAPVLQGGLVAGMKFTFVATANNTGPDVTMAVNGGSLIDIVNDKGDPLVLDQIVADRVHGLFYDGADFRLENSSGQGVTFAHQVFVASGSWVKPTGISDSALVMMELWGGGGAGGNHNRGGGGGGGAFERVFFKAGDLPATLDVTVPILTGFQVTGGDAVVSDGGTPLAIAYGGGYGTLVGGTTGGNGGGGGGHSKAGANGSNTAADKNAGAGSTGAQEPDEGGDGIGNGGGGGSGGQSSGGAGGTLIGGDAEWGGGGGAGGNGTTGGTGGNSKHGGDGGDWGVDGQAPGGGGGNSGWGARGEIRIHVIG